MSNSPQTVEANTIGGYVDDSNLGTYSAPKDAIILPGIKITVESVT